MKNNEMMVMALRNGLDAFVREYGGLEHGGDLEKAVHAAIRAAALSSMEEGRAKGFEEAAEIVIGLARREKLAREHRAFTHPNDIGAQHTGHARQAVLEEAVGTIKSCGASHDRRND